MRILVPTVVHPVFFQVHLEHLESERQYHARDLHGGQIMLPGGALNIHYSKASTT